MARSGEHTSDSADLEQNDETEQRKSGLPRSSIADTAYQRVRVRKTTSTSAKVDHVAAPPQSKAVDNFQANTLQRLKKTREEMP